MWQRCRRLRRLGRACGGNVAMIFGLGMPIIGIGLAGAIDVNTWYSARNRLQIAADGAALAAAKEMQLAIVSNSRTGSGTAEAYVRSLLTSKGLVPTQVQSTTNIEKRTVEVGVSAEVSPIFSRFLSDGLRTISVRSVARLSSTAPVCVIGLDTSQPGTLHFEKNAQLTANRCAVYSNSKDRQSIQAEDGATLSSAFFCAAGGYSNKRSTFTPTPVTDCPPIADPLADRSTPAVGACTANNTVIAKGATVTLMPGVYCGGLKVTDTSQVTLLSGIYVIKDGPLTVDKQSSFQGQNVALFFSGNKAALLFDQDSTISLTAPRDGPMAGILMSEDRNVSDPTPAPLPIIGLLTGLLPGPPPKLPPNAPPMREYRIISDDARMLLGTIYLPLGRLMIDSTKAVADRSAYTVIVVRRLDLFDGPNLYLNSDYGATDIPVPAGVGPVAGVASLAR